MACKWSKCLLIDAAAKFSSRNEFRIGNNGAYKSALRQGLLDEVCLHMPINAAFKWDSEAIKLEAEKYSSRKEFSNNAKGAYSAALLTGILDEVCTHMHLNFTYWTYEEIHKAALEHSTRHEFEIGSSNAYKAASYRGILDEVCYHMKKVATSPFISVNKVQGIYMLLSCDEVVYIGKSTNINNRVNGHYREREKEFDAVHAYSVPSDADMHVLEIYLINEYKPKYNKDSVGSSTLTININEFYKAIDKEFVINLKEEF